MILQPGFLDHWKTRLLVELAGDERAIFAVLRLWEFCQMRRRWHFNGEISDAALDAICRLKCARALLTQSGFLDEKEDKMLIVHDFEVENRTLINSWINGAKGGKKPTRTHSKTHRNPRVARGQPVPLILSTLILSSLKEGVRGRFEEWMKVRRAMGKAPKDWNVMFAEQLKWLQQFDEKGQTESLSASIRNNWQGLFPPGKNYGTHQKHPPQSNRNTGTLNEGKSTQYAGYGKV